MIQEKRVLAYIPARSGSKNIIDKNIIEVGGKPLIAYTIEAALGSRYVDRIIVSTDSAKYAAIARRYGAEVPFLRPAKLATDTSPEMETTMQLIQWVEQNEGQGYDLIVRLQATSPLRTAVDIDKALLLLFDKNADSIISVFKCPVTPLWMNTLPTDLSMKGFIADSILRKNRQELPQYYQLNGAIFASRWEVLKRTKNWYGERAFAFIMPEDRSVDVDDELNLELVRFLIQKNFLGRESGKEVL